MFDHLGIVVSDLAAGRRFYEVVLKPLGIRLLQDNVQTDGTGWLVFGTGAPNAPFFVVAAGRPSFWTDGHEAGKSPLHLSFRAPSKDSVDRFHAAGLGLGARNNGDPGVRRKPFYCAFLIDPDGNNLEAGLHLEG